MYKYDLNFKKYVQIFHSFQFDYVQSSYNKIQETFL
jgi:hypothetical protein